jgi:hypothetical protein
MDAQSLRIAAGSGRCRPQDRLTISDAADLGTRLMSKTHPPPPHSIFNRDRLLFCGAAERTAIHLPLLNWYFGPVPAYMLSKVYYADAADVAPVTTTSNSMDAL